MDQIGTTRRAILRTNETFDYDKPGKTVEIYSKLQILSTDKFLFFSCRYYSSLVSIYISYRSWQTSTTM